MDVHTEAHKRLCIYSIFIYLHFSWRDAKDFFTIEFSCNSVAEMLLLSSL